MNQSGQGKDGAAARSDDPSARSAFATVPAAPTPQHQTQPTTTQSITASQLAAMATGSNPYSAVDHNAAFMMSNAAATLAAVAASAVQQMQQAKGATIAPTSAASAGSAAALSSSLYHAALQGNRNPLIPGPTPTPVSSVPHAALLTALANAGQHSAVQSITAAAPPISDAASAAAAAASSLLRPSPPVLSQPTSLNSPALLSDMQSWSLEQLDAHIALLQQMNQSVPHSVAILRAEAERKIKKKNDKRVANRKSASNSRARKKALVEEMTKTNARLKKQAMILALLPDLVMTITTDGAITFCSAQAERILQHKTDDMIGAKLFHLLVPKSRHALKVLIEELVHPGKAKAARALATAQARRGTKRMIKPNKSEDGNNANKAGDSNAHENSNGSGRGSSRNGGNSTDDTSGAAIVSEQSFPMSVVNVESKQQSQGRNQGAETGSNENLDSSTSNSGGSGEDDGEPSMERKKDDKERKNDAAQKNTRPRGDDFSSLSSETKNQTANNNLDRNVRWHKQRMLEDNKKSEPDNGPKDDVTGAPVTANNASARLSSLEHCPNGKKCNKKNEAMETTGDQSSSSDDSLLGGVEERKKEDASDDSGYRESNDSREESSSSWSDTSRSNDHQKKPLAPTCRLCLIRNDLTTVWCEVTSSIRNKSCDDDIADAKATNSKSTEGSDTSKSDQELLLCLRPIRNSSKKVDESLRFIPKTRSASSMLPRKDNDDNTTPMVSTGTSSSGDTNSRGAKAANAKQETQQHGHHELNKKRPPKKRLLATGSTDAYDPNQKRAKTESNTSTSQNPNASETEKSVVESLMLMNKSSQ